MLLRHSFYYLIARGIPGVISFAALILYTRLLSTEEFGRYAVILASVGLVQVLLFQWLHLVLARFLPGDDGKSSRVLASILAIFLSLSAILILSGFILALAWSDTSIRLLIFLTVLLSIAAGWMEICLKLESVRIQPAIYGRMLTTKNTVSLISACTLIWMGLASSAPLIGLLLGVAMAWAIFGRQAWKAVRPIWPSKTVLKDYAAYGFPLAITFALGWVVSSSDRLIIAWLLDKSATGAYAAGYDLAQQTLGLLLVIVNTAAYPLVMRALTQHGHEAAKRQLAVNGELIITIAMVSAAGMIGLAPALVGTVIGSDFRPEAANVVPWIAASAAVAGIKAFHLDVPFQLAKDPKWQAYTAAIAAVFNVLLNFLLIPILGLTGAAAATLISLSLACMLSWLIGKKVYPIPSMTPAILRAGMVSIFAYSGARTAELLQFEPLITLLVGFAAGFSAAFIAGWLVNICGIRGKIATQLRRRWG